MLRNVRNACRFCVPFFRDFRLNAIGEVQLGAFNGITAIREMYVEYAV